MINTFFLRVSAICNLKCDYCYVFKHNDDLWKKIPPIMEDRVIDAFISQLVIYYNSTGLNELNIIFHGGEPTLIGLDKIIQVVEKIKHSLKFVNYIFFSIQTNGTLLNYDFINKCFENNIGISVSLDGSKIEHDKHRIYKNNKGSFNDVLNNLKILEDFPSIFDGIIGVIDFSNDCNNILEFFKSIDIYNIDLLVPDMNYDESKEITKLKHKEQAKWLINLFDIWFYKYNFISFRTFESIIMSMAGSNISLDTFGGGELDYITIETDGSYHTSDILKVAYNGASKINKNVFNDKILDVIVSDEVKKYNLYLSSKFLPLKCKICKFKKICKGGSLPHRYSKKKGFRNPSAYCYEFKQLFKHISKTLSELKQ